MQKSFLMQFSLFIHSADIIGIGTWSRYGIKRIHQCNFTNQTSNQNNNRWYAGFWQSEGLNTNLHSTQNDTEKLLITGFAWNPRQTFRKLVHNSHKHIKNHRRLDDGEIQTWVARRQTKWNSLQNVSRWKLFESSPRSFFRIRFYFLSLS